MKDNKKPLIIILVILATIAAGLLLANYMFNQVDVNLEKEESSHSVYFEQDEHFSIFVNES